MAAFENKSFVFFQKRTSDSFYEKLFGKEIGEKTGITFMLNWLLQLTCIKQGL